MKKPKKARGAKWQLPFFNGPNVYRNDANFAAVLEANRKQFKSDLSAQTLLKAQVGFATMLKRRGWRIGRDGFVRRGVLLESAEGFKKHRTENTEKRSLDAKFAVAVDLLSSKELDVAMAAYNAGVIHAEMIAYRDKAGAAGRPQRVTVQDVEAAYQRFIATKGNRPAGATGRRLGRAPYWTHARPLTPQKFTEWKKWRATN